MFPVFSIAIDGTAVPLEQDPRELVAVQDVVGQLIVTAPAEVYEPEDGFDDAALH